MKGIWKRLGFRRPDEMERFILFKAQRNAYLFLIAALFLWTVYESCRVYIHHSRLNLMPCLLLVGASLIQGFSQLVMTRSAVKDDDDSYETGPLVRIVVLACAAAGVLAAAAAALVLMGVRSRSFAGPEASARRTLPRLWGSPARPSSRWKTTNTTPLWALPCALPDVWTRR